MGKGLSKLSCMDLAVSRESLSVEPKSPGQVHTNLAAPTEHRVESQSPTEKNTVQGSHIEKPLSPTQQESQQDTTTEAENDAAEKPLSPTQQDTTTEAENNAAEKSLSPTQQDTTTEAENNASEKPLSPTQQESQQDTTTEAENNAAEKPLSPTQQESQQDTTTEPENNAAEKSLSPTRSKSQAENVTVQNSVVAEPFEPTQKDTESNDQCKKVVPCETLPQQQEEEEGEEKEYLAFPILSDSKTVDYVKKSKVMVIMKGLPGSGKSTIVQRLTAMYPEAAVCSADHYFMQDGQYKFDKEQLTAAHQACRERAEAAAAEGRHVVIIDNTNVRAWESKPYLGMTRRHCYTPLMLEPRTPWAMDAKELARKTKHGISEEVLLEKLNSYSPAYPLYYWWWLSEVDSVRVMTLAQHWLREAALTVPAFLQDLSHHTTTTLTTLNDLLHYYTKDKNGSTDCTVLHATACVTRRGKEQGALQYIKDPAVREAMGMCFDLTIVGYVITPRTFVARLRLSDACLKVWGMDDQEQEEESAKTPLEGNTKAAKEQSDESEEHRKGNKRRKGKPEGPSREAKNAKETSTAIPPSQPKGKEGEESKTASGSTVKDDSGKSDTLPQTAKNQEKLSNESTEDSVHEEVVEPRFTCEETVREVPLAEQVSDVDRFAPTSGRGSRAHLTLGCAPDVHPRVSGFDLINVVAREQRWKAQVGHLGGGDMGGGEGLQVERFPLAQGGEVRNYGEGFWVIYPSNEVIVSSLFSGHY